MVRVTELTVSPVRGFALQHREEILLGERGVDENRRFHFVDDDGRRFTLTRCGDLARIAAAYDAGAERLTFTFEDGTVVDGLVEIAEPITTRFYGNRPVRGHVVVGPWAEAVSAFVGEHVRLVRLDPPGQAHKPQLAASILSRASLEELARHAGGSVDGRRFRMLIGIDGCAPHEEDDWIGRQVRVGDAVIEPAEPVGRCMITTRNPETGEVDLDTLKLIKSYRGLRDKAIPFGIAGAVVEPGRIRVGDAVELL
jgi:uncharacterized protein